MIERVFQPRVRAAEVDQSGDRGPHRRVRARDAVAEADVAHRLVGVVGEREHVAVAGEPVPEPLRHRQAELPGAQQDLRRPQRPGREHDDVGGDEPGRGGSLAEDVEAHPPGALAAAHGLHRHLGEDVRPVRVSVGEVVHQDRVLGPVVAARAAVAAQVARVLPHPDGVRAAGERHVEVGADHLAAEAGRRLFERLQLGQLRPRLRVRVGPEHLPGRAHIRPQGLGVLPQRGRPAVVGEDRVARLEGHARVDQRGAAEPAARQHGHVGADLEVEQADRGPVVRLGRMDLDLTRGRQRRVRVLPRVQLLAPLQDADIPPGPRDTGGDDRPAVSRANHNRRVVGLYLVDWTG